jgi:hypothetical protein
MTDRVHLEEFGEGISEGLAKKLVATFVECHRNPSLSSADVVTRLKEQMEQALSEDADAPA